MQAGLELINAELLRRGIQLVIQNSDVDAGWRAERLGERKIYFRVVGLDGGLVFHFGDWRDASAKFTMHTHGDKPSAKTARELKRLTKELEKEREGKALIAKGMVEELFERWRSSDTGDSSDYLEKKNLKRPEGVVVRPGVNDRQKILVVPMFDASGEFWNVQQIFGNGRKLYQKNARKKGLMHVLGGPGDGLGGPVGDASAGPVYVGEGFATCLAAWEVMQHKTYVSFDVKNLEAVVQAAVKRFGPERVVILADFDGATYIKTGENPGMLAAQKLSLKYRVRVAVPVGLEAGVQENVDFADLGAAERGEALSDGRLVGWEDLTQRVFELPREKKKKAPAVAAETEAVEVVRPPAATQPLDVKALVLKAKDRLEDLNTEDKLPKDAWFKRIEPTATPGGGGGEPEPAIVFPTQDDGFFFKHEGEERVKYSPDYDGFALYMRAKHHLKTNDGFNYRYADHHYKTVSNLELKNLTKRAIRPNQTPSMIAAFSDVARMENFTHADELLEPQAKINLANGVLNVKNRELLAHSPKYFFRYKLPHAYDPEARCPNWLKFLNATFEGNEALVSVLAEIFGYTLLGGEPFLHKAFVLSGDGRNGKSAVLDVLKYLIGPTNFSSIPVENLNKPFSVIMADGKLANIIGETTADRINSEAFKTAVGGEQLIAAQKNMPEFAMCFTARMIMACNKLPHLGDATSGAYEKFFILPFNRYLHESERTASFAQLNLFPEAAGIINWALDGLERLIRRGKRLPKIDAVSEQTVQLREENDVVYAWMLEHVKFDETARDTHQVKDFYGHFVEWCKNTGRQYASQNTFCKRIAAEFKRHPSLTHSYPGRVFTVTSGVRIDVKRRGGAGLAY